MNKISERPKYKVFFQNSRKPGYIRFLHVQQHEEQNHADILNAVMSQGFLNEERGCLL